MGVLSGEDYDLDSFIIAIKLIVNISWSSRQPNSVITVINYSITIGTTTRWRQ